MLKCFGKFCENLVILIFSISLLSCGNAGGGNSDGSTNNTNNIPTDSSLISLTITPSQASTHLGAPIQFTAVANYSDGTAKNVTTLASWNSSNVAVADVGETPGLATPKSSGNTNITAVYSGASASGELSVSDSSLRNIIITPNSANIYVGSSQQFIATGIYFDGESQDITNQCSWSSLNELVIVVNESGNAIAMNQGSTVIKAKYGSVESQANTNVKLYTVLNTWVNGEKVVNSLGNYGESGVESVGNTPSARHSAASWVDLNGNFWLFGGDGYDSKGNNGYLNDLWKYDVSKNMWVFLGGSTTYGSFGKYGTKGTESTTNIPGARDGAVTWVDRSGNLWLFGGAGYAKSDSGFLNDLWRYDTYNNVWAWVSGTDSTNSTGTYVNIGVPSPNYSPASREYASAWVDSSGNFWLFGGSGQSSAGKDKEGILNDLWKYNLKDNSWTWVNGNNTINESANYGTQGIKSKTNTPGSRNSAVSWIDHSGNLWLFGGKGYESDNVSGLLNDVWKYEIRNNVWVWEAGSNKVDESGAYDLKGVESAANFPGSRGYAVGWVGKAGDLWLFGGYGFSSSGSPNYLNDLWKFDTKSKKWVWVSGNNGTNSTGIYGQKGAGSVNNMPGGRSFSSGWVGKDGNLWIFGGEGYAESSSFGYLNDLWQIQSQ